MSEYAVGDLVEWVADNGRDWRLRSFNSNWNEDNGKVSLNRGDRGLIVDVFKDDGKWFVVFVFRISENTILIPGEQYWAKVEV